MQYWSLHAYLFVTLKMMLITNTFFTSPILLTTSFSRLVLSLEMVALASGRAYVYVKLEKIPRVVRGKILRDHSHV